LLRVADADFLAWPRPATNANLIRIGSRDIDENWTISHRYIDGTFKFIALEYAI